MRIKLTIPVLILFLVISDCASTKKDHAGITINFWYGNNQQFGNQGISQPYINILGNVSSEKKLKTVKFALNGGEYRNLQTGTNISRLEYTGDFNIELDTDCLLFGENKIMIIAVDSLDQKADQTVCFSYSPQKWPLPYAVSWDTVSGIQDAVQVIDGEWKVDSSGVTVVKPGYDRLLTVGDYRSWENYEITVKVTPHGLDGWLSIGLRWKGHYRDRDEEHPYNGWNNAGCSGWIVLHEKRLWFEYATGLSNPDKMIIDIEDEKPFYWKIRVKTVAENKHLYSQRVWKTTDKEPDWWMEVLESPVNKYQAGSVYLLAHRSSVTYGDLIVEELTDH